MKRIFPSVAVGAMGVVLALAPRCASAQQALTWDQVKARFEATQSCVESRCRQCGRDARRRDHCVSAAESTVHSIGRRHADRAARRRVAALQGHVRSSPTSATCTSATTSANCGWKARRKARALLKSQHEDLKRNLEFTLRAAFVQTLEAKAVLDMAKADLDYYDKIIDISRDAAQGRRHRPDRF